MTKTQANVMEKIDSKSKHGTTDDCVGTGKYYGMLAYSLLYYSEDHATIATVFEKTPNTINKKTLLSGNSSGIFTVNGHL